MSDLLETLKRVVVDAAIGCPRDYGLTDFFGVCTPTRKNCKECWQAAITAQEVVQTTHIDKTLEQIRQNDL